MSKRKQRTLEQVSIGELKMEMAKVEYQIQKTRETITKVDEKVDEYLKKCNASLDVSTLEDIGHEVAFLVGEQRDLRQKLSSFSSKRQILQRLISIKETSATIMSKKRDLIDSLDLNAILTTQEYNAFETDLHEARAKSLLIQTGAGDDYAQVLAILRSTSYDGESLASAKTELEDLTRRQTL